MRLQRTYSASSPQRGYSLAEVLVAMAVFTVIVIAALLLYDRSNKMFKQSMEATDMQQNTRVAFNKLVSDIRLAGFDFDRDGIPFGTIAPQWKAGTSYVVGNRVQANPSNGHTYTCTQGGTAGGAPPKWDDSKNAIVAENSPSTVIWKESGDIQYQQADEQIEYAGPAAIAFRANFNYELSDDPCPTSGAPKPCENGREQDLESSAFEVVTTRNSEIVTYALVSNSGNANANKDKLTFYADVAGARHVYAGSGDTDEDKVEITGVDLTNKYPPYTLYRYTLRDSGAPDGGTPIADNIRSVNFRYFTDLAGTSKSEIGCGDATKCSVANFPNGEGVYDAKTPDTLIAERDVRASVKSIRIALVGMNAEADRRYNDTTDTVAPNYRKFPLETLVVPRNLGKRGMKEFSTEQPGAPTLESVCVGSCNAIYASWTPPSGITGEIDSYNILYEEGDCSKDPDTYAHAEDAGNNLDGYATLFVTPGKSYRVSVQSINKFGSATAGQCMEVTVLNTTKPDVPGLLIASGGTDPDYPEQQNKVDLYWPPTTTNQVFTTFCQPSGTKDEQEIPWAENIYYQVWRSADENFDPTDGKVDEVKILDLPKTPTMDVKYLKYSDTTAGNCEKYFYRIQTVDSCIKAAAMNFKDDILLAQSGVFPKIGDPAIMGVAKTAQTPSPPTNLAVTAQNPSPPSGLTDVTVSWTPVTTDSDGKAMNVANYVLTATPTSGGTAVSITTPYAFGTLDDLDAGKSYNITATAKDCASTTSAALPWPCNWTHGNPSITFSETFGGLGTSMNPYIIETPTSMTVTFSSAISKLQITAINTVTGATIGTPFTDNTAKTTYTYSLPNPPDGVAVQLRVVATSADGKCTLSPSVYVYDSAPPPCELLDDSTDPNVVTFSNGSDTVNVTLKNSSATNVLTIKKVVVNWNTGIAAGGTKLSDIILPKAGGGTVDGLPNNSDECNNGTVKADFTNLGPATVTGGQTNYPIQIRFSKTQTNFIVTGVCIIYQSAVGDLKQCTIYPSAGSCTEPASSCQ